MHIQLSAVVFLEGACCTSIGSWISILPQGFAQLRCWSSQGLHRRHCCNTRHELTPRTMSSKKGRIVWDIKKGETLQFHLPATNQLTTGNLVSNNSTSWLFKPIAHHLTGFEGAQLPIFWQASCRWNECRTPGSTKQWHFIWVSVGQPMRGWT